MWNIPSAVLLTVCYICAALVVVTQVRQKQADSLVMHSILRKQIESHMSGRLMPQLTALTGRQGSANLSPEVLPFFETSASYHLDSDQEHVFKDIDHVVLHVYKYHPRNVVFETLGNFYKTFMSRIFSQLMTFVSCSLTLTRTNTSQNRWLTWTGVKDIWGSRPLWLFESIITAPVPQDHQHQFIPKKMCFEAN